MAKQRPTKAAGDYLRGFASEDGQHFRTERQELGPAMKRVQEIRDLHGQATRADNPNEWRHVGSIPMTVLIDWLKQSGYTIDQWARNDDNSKQKFLKYFLSRDFSKLHNVHVTTKTESSQILMPGDPHAELRRIKSGDS